MKKFFLVLGLTAACSAATAFVVLHFLQGRHAAQVAAMEATWQQERASLMADLQSAQTDGTAPLRQPVAPASSAAAPTPTQPDCAAIVARLSNLKSGGIAREKMARQMIHDLEELIAAGPTALPAIREYLARNDDVDFRGLGGEWAKWGAIPDAFVVPPTLRFGLLDATRQIGGPGAEGLLAEVLSASGRGSEVAWLARVLNAMAPDKYRDAALAAAREGLANPRASADGKGYDRIDRDQFFSVLTMFGDTGYATTAQSQLVMPDNTIDRSALKYLLQALGAQSVPVVAQLYADPRLSDPAQREPLARLALNFVGADGQANEFYNKAINDMALSKDHRRNLIEDLNQDGFSNRKTLTDRDLPLIENRIALIEQLAPRAADAVNLAAFQEAYKDLVNMRERVLNPPVAVKK
jgi:hypothetical protein